MNIYVRTFVVGIGEKRRNRESRSLTELTKGASVVFLVF